jgi:L-ascorbate metabolism protein UlaG (beta-lactamase superfamily)
MGMTVEALKEYAAKHLRWYGNSAFRIATDAGPVVFLDPAGPLGEAGRADLVLVSHPHWDHVDRRSLAVIRGPHTVVLAPQSALSRELAWLEGAEGLAAGQRFRIDGVAVQAVAAYNLSRPFHARENGWLGYLVETDGLRIYHAGDTDCIPEMGELRPDVALLPVGGFFTMNVEQALEAMAALRPGLVIPMHYGPLVGGRRAGHRLKARAGEACLVLPPGGGG